MGRLSWFETKPLKKVIRLRWIFYLEVGFGLISVAGCLRVLSLDYQATNSIRGEGAVRVAGFHYQAADEQRVRAHEVETPAKVEAKLFLSEKIGTVFSQALQSELARSGYTIIESSPRTISGIVTRFYLDWRIQSERTFELEVTYTVQLDGRQPFSWGCSSVKRGLNMLEEDALLIRAGIADCIQHFLLAAMDAQVL